MSDRFEFSKQVRLLKKHQFQEILANKQSLLGLYYTLYYCPNGLTYARLGIIAAKKKCRLAVLRNRIRRQVREAFRYCHSKLPHHDIIIVARQSACEASRYELRQCLDSLFLKFIGHSC